MPLRIISVITFVLYAGVIFQMLSFITGSEGNLTTLYKGAIVLLCFWLLISVIGFFRFKEWGRKQVVSANITVAFLILFFKLSIIFSAYGEGENFQSLINNSVNSVEVIWYISAVAMVFFAFYLRKDNVKKSFAQGM